MEGMEIWRLEEPIIQQVFQPCEALQRRARFLLDHVDGEVEDEDGDCANGFILADPIPSPYIRSLHSSSGTRKHKLDGDCDPAAVSSSEAWFYCNMCHKNVPLELLALPSSSCCSCLFCRECLESYAGIVISNSIKEVLHIRNKQDDSSASSSSKSKCRKLMTVVDLTGDDDSSSSCSSSSEYLQCPSPLCDGKFQLTDIQSVSPDCFAKWEAAVSEALFKNSSSFVKCPGCQVVIEKVKSDLPPGLALSGVPEVDRTVPFTELDEEGKPLSRRAMIDKAVNRFRCALCSLEFCGACLESPYHLGRTCDEFLREKKAIRCIYCDQVCRYSIGDSCASTSSVKDLRGRLDVEGVDSGWCVEKSDLVAVTMLCDRVCQAKECRQRLKASCTRKLHCGHHCCGVRGERHCLPCLEEHCKPQALSSATDYCAICLVEPLRSAPSILLQCGHVVHFHCAKRQIQQGYPGPQISFGYLTCPQCKILMKHSRLDMDMLRHIAMMGQIKTRAIKRMQLEDAYEKLKAEGHSEEKLVSIALEQHQYYICSKCKNPYYGGKRNCGVNLANDQARQYDPSDLVCGGCSAGSEGKCRRGHGKEYVEFKCRFCCSIATFFCFGTTHFCDKCHVVPPRNPVECKGPKFCPLRVAHAPNGKEHCLGCSMCRSEEQL